MDNRIIIDQEDASHILEKAVIQNFNGNSPHSYLMVENTDQDIISVRLKDFEII